jgi:uncharacterized protein (DUF58 family)
MQRVWPRDLVGRWLNRGLPENRRIRLRVGWPLWLLPVIYLNQLLAPHVVWMALAIMLTGIYSLAYLWARSQAPVISLKRRRIGAILVAGDILAEEMEVHNSGQLPLLWAEFIDYSTVPGYTIGRIVATGAASVYPWRSQAECRRRGVFQLGPHELNWHDPFGLFAVTLHDEIRDAIVIYPRVVHLPRVSLPHGDAEGADRRRRPLPGTVPAATVSDYHAGDSLRYVHWSSTARRGRMMVKDLEIEPSGDVWLVLDLNKAAQRGEGVAGTLEQAVVVAASLAADWLTGREQRSVGLLAYSGIGAEGRLVQVAPGMGRGQLWQVLAALAPVEAGDLALSHLLDTSLREVGRRGTVVVITPDLGGARDEEQAVKSDWIGALARLNRTGAGSSVVLVTLDDPAEAPAVAKFTELLAPLDTPVTHIQAADTLRAVLTYRRRRTVLRSTPTGGVIAQEVDEEVG